MAKKQYVVRGYITLDVEFLVFADSAEDAESKINLGEWEYYDEYNQKDWGITDTPKEDK